MTFNKTIKKLKQLLKNKKPVTFNSSWILKNDPAIYRFIFRNVRSKIGGIDWDKITSSLPRRFQRIWIPPHHKPKIFKTYRSKKEVDLALKNHRHKLYVFVALLEEDDKWLRDTIAIPLVRIAQKGNLRAEEKLLFLLKQIIHQWVEYCPRLYRWRGQNEELDVVIKRCIRCYRFTGSFIGYLFKSLEYSALGLRSFQAYSLDKYFPGTTSNLLDTLTKNPQSGQVVRAKNAGSYFFH